MLARSQIELLCYQLMRKQNPLFTVLLRKEQLCTIAKRIAETKKFDSVEEYINEVVRAATEFYHKESGSDKVRMLL